MNLTKRIEALVYLGGKLQLQEEELLAVQHRSKHHNGWFTLDNSTRALEEIRTQFLQKEKLEAWAAHYGIAEKSVVKNVGLILAGNVPLAGFHDVLCVFVSGHHAKIKLSKDDQFFIPYFIKIMQEQFPEVENYFSVVERMTDFDAIIASGSKDAVKTYATYFSKYPNLVRKNKFGVAVLDGTESKEDLANFGKDLFHYFGLSSRSVSKIYIPKDYDFVPLLEAAHEFNEIVLHNKYKNNFDFNYTLQIINKMQYKANGCIMMIEDTALQSRIAMLHYEYFEDAAHLEKLLAAKAEDIQHVISNLSGGQTGNTFTNFRNKNFGEANTVALGDYLNGRDVMDFLKDI